jgi:hypothetical protein
VIPIFRIEQYTEVAGLGAAVRKTLAAVVAVTATAELLVRIVNEQTIVGNGAPRVVQAVRAAVTAG